MPLKSFKVGPTKSLVLASTETVPPVMVIAGPNGVGKSTLLYGIKNGGGTTTGNTRLFYQGPNRVLRRTQVQRRWLGGAIKWMTDLMSGGDVSGYEGLSFQNSSRTPDNVDEAGSTIKHTLGKIENRRQATIAELVDRTKASKGDLKVSELPDVYEPLRLMTQHLLPHLAFNRVDFANEDSILCLWNRVDAANKLELDIDDLSSGEKSIVVLFLPLLEDQIREKLDLLIAATKPVTQPKVVEDRVVLVDEPEQHLHPDLQAKILNYMRSVTKEGHVQFVITTHSPTILDQATDDELYVLSAPSGVAGENQLRRVANNLDRLEALRELAGSTYFLTTGRAVVCVEGESGDDPAELTDVRLLELMYPRATAVTLVPTTGKSSVITTVARLREHVPEDVFRIRVRGLVDADQKPVSVAGVESLPVAMIENFLLDPHAIFAVASERNIASLSSVAETQKTLDDIARGLEEDEIALRVRAKLKKKYVYLKGSSLETVKVSHARELAAVQALLPSDQALEEIVSSSRQEVEQLLKSGLVLSRFRGKQITKAIYKAHFSAGDYSYSQFCIAVATKVGTRGEVAKLLDPIFDRLVS